MQLPFTVDFSGKTAVVTGGGGVLCGVLAKALGASGAAVAVCDLNHEAAESVAHEIRSTGGVAAAYETDVLSRENLEDVCLRVEKELGSCDILINGAGGNHPRGTTSDEYLNIDDVHGSGQGHVSFFDLDPQGIRFVMDLNFLGALLPSQVFAKDMAAKEHAAIVNISSMNAFTPLTKIPAYSAAKAAVSNFTQWLAVHLSRTSIRVNAIAPGFFLTEQNRSLLMKDDSSYTERAEKIIQNTPMRRFGDPRELIGTLFWLAHPAASGFVNGTVIPVDGGFSAYSGV